MYGTKWALLPPLVAILLALITKEAYSSLFVGIIIGALFVAGLNPAGFVATVIESISVNGFIGLFQGIGTALSTNAIGFHPVAATDAIVNDG